MGCLRLKYQTSESSLKVVYSNVFALKNNAQRFLSVDPLAHEFPWQSPYMFCDGNPINKIDPDGRAATPPSTHVDENGKVIAQYDDKDNGVYVHSIGTKKSEVSQQRTDNSNTGGTGRYIGEIGGTININVIYKNKLSRSIEEAGRIWSPFTFKEYVKTGGKWDLKANKNTIYGLANDGKTKFLFNGKTMESQDVGNHHFGAVALAYGLFPSEEFILKQAGEYQIKSGTSKAEWQQYRIDRVPVFSKSGALSWKNEKVSLPPYGDDPRDQKWIKAGFQYYKNNND